MRCMLLLHFSLQGTFVLEDPDPRNYLKPTNCKDYMGLVSNKNEKITRESKPPSRFADRLPTGYIFLIVNIASLVCRDTQNNEEYEQSSKLEQKILNQLSVYFENINANECKRGNF